MICRVPSHEHTRAPDFQAMSDAESLYSMGSGLPGYVGCRVFVSTGSGLPGYAGCRVMSIYGPWTLRLCRVPSLDTSRVPQVFRHGARATVDIGSRFSSLTGPAHQPLSGPAYAVTSGPVYSQNGLCVARLPLHIPRTDSFPSDTSLQCTSRRSRWREEWSRQTCPRYWCSCLCSTWLLLP